MLQALHSCLQINRIYSGTALAGCVTCPFPFSRSPWIGTCFPSVEPWGGTHGGAGCPEPSPSLRPSACWEAQCPAGDIQVTVSEVLA